MRVIYIAPRTEDFSVLFTKPAYRGGGSDEIQAFNSPVFYQRGSGLFSVIGSLLRRSIPFLRSVFLPTVADVGRNIAKKYSEGMSFREAAKQEAMTGAKDLGARVLKGGRKRRKKTSSQKPVIGRFQSRGVKKKKNPTRKKKVVLRDSFPSDIFTRLNDS
jgi:hypothetical protein